MDRWEHWPYGAYDPHRAREINELLEIASDHEAANDPDTIIYEEPEELDEDLVERLEVAGENIEQDSE